MSKKPQFKTVFIEYTGAWMHRSHFDLNKDTYRALGEAGIEERGFSEAFWKETHENKGLLAAAYVDPNAKQAFVQDRQAFLDKLGLPLQANFLIFTQVYRPIRSAGIEALNLRMRKEGIKTVLVGNVFPDSLKFANNSINSRQFDDVIFSADPEVAVALPSQDFIELALERSDTDPREALFVTTDPDVAKAARKLGIESAYTPYIIEIADQAETALVRRGFEAKLGGQEIGVGRSLTE